MTITYRAYCKMHAEFQAPVRTAYEDAVNDMTDHQAEAHELGVATLESE